MLRALKLWRTADGQPPAADPAAAPAAQAGEAASGGKVVAVPQRPVTAARPVTSVPPQGGWVRAMPQGEAYREAIDRAPMQAWLATLPIAVRPGALAGIYPRIVKRIMLLWEDDAALLAYVDDLVVDKRGGRIGFPPKVAAEIARLYDFIRLRAAGRGAGPGR